MQVYMLVCNTPNLCMCIVIVVISSVLFIYSLYIKCCCSVYLLLLLLFISIFVYCFILQTPLNKCIVFETHRTEKPWVSNASSLARLSNSVRCSRFRYKYYYIWGYFCFSLFFSCIYGKELQIKKQKKVKRD